MRDVIWRAPAELKHTLENSKLFKSLDEFVILTKGHDGAFETSMAVKWVDGKWYIDAPLGDFCLNPFNPFAYELIAVVDYIDPEVK